MSYAHQDWKPVVLKKKVTKPRNASQLAAAKRKGQVTSVARYGAGTNRNLGPSNARKLDDNERDDFKHTKVSHSFKVALMKARQAKKMTQAQLAQRLNVKQTVINEYESGKAIPNGQLISKMNRILGTKLPKIPKRK